MDDVTEEHRKAREREHAEEAERSRQQRMIETHLWVDSCKGDGQCVDCGYKFAPVKLDFIRTDGGSSVSKLLPNAPRETVIEAMFASNLVCANCQRARRQVR